MRLMSRQRRRGKSRSSWLVVQVLLFAFLSVKCERRPVEKPVSPVLDHVVIRYVRFDIETPVSIGSNTLVSYFGPDVKAMSLYDRPFLDSLDHLVSALKPSSKGFLPDVRLVLEMHYSSGVRKAASMSHNALSLDGQEMEFDSTLLRMLQRKTNQLPD